MAFRLAICLHEPHPPKLKVPELEKIKAGAVFRLCTYGWHLLQGPVAQARSGGSVLKLRATTA